MKESNEKRKQTFKQQSNLLESLGSVMDKFSEDLGEDKGEEVIQPKEPRKTLDINKELVLSVVSETDELCQSVIDMAIDDYEENEVNADEGTEISNEPDQIPPKPE